MLEYNKIYFIKESFILKNFMYNKNRKSDFITNKELLILKTFSMKNTNRRKYMKFKKNMMGEKF